MAKKQADIRHYDVVLAPHITEKATMASEHNAVVFRVAGDAARGHMALVVATAGLALTLGQALDRTTLV